jgi:hypothetical protein
MSSERLRLVLILTLLSIGVQVESITLNPLTPLTVNANSTLAVIYVYPRTNAGAIRENFEIDVRIANVTDLYGWEFRLGWNATLSDVVNVVEGPFLETGGNTYFTKKVNATDGYAIVDGTLLKNIPGVSGNGTLASITFNVKGYGDCLLDLYDVILLNSNEQSIHCKVLVGYGHFIPEFLSILIPAIFMVMTLVAIAASRKGVSNLLRQKNRSSMLHKSLCKRFIVRCCFSC